MFTKLNSLIRELTVGYYSCNGIPEANVRSNHSMLWARWLVLTGNARWDPENGTRLLKAKPSLFRR